MNTDRELLELAAKAAGLRVGDWIPGVGMMRYEGGPGSYSKHRWNPLTDDGDALRLAVSCRITDLAMAVGHLMLTTDFQGDKFAATRRAIVVRAAAALAESEQGEAP